MKKKKNNKGFKEWAKPEELVVVKEKGLRTVKLNQQLLFSGFAHLEIAHVVEIKENTALLNNGYKINSTYSRKDGNIKLLTNSSIKFSIRIMDDKSNKEWDKFLFKTSMTKLKVGIETYTKGDMENWEELTEPLKDLMIKLGL